MAALRPRYDCDPWSYVGMVCLLLYVHSLECYGYL